MDETTNSTPAETPAPQPSVEAPSTPLTDDQRQGLQQELAGAKQELGDQNQAHVEKLGEIAAGTGQEVHVAPNGVVLTDEEHADALARRV